MTTYDTTVFMLRELPESDLRQVLYFVRDTFFPNRPVEETATMEDSFRTFTADEVFMRLEETRHRIENGTELLMDAHHASSVVRKKYGIQ